MEKESEHVREGEKAEKGNKSIMVEALFLKWCPLVVPWQQSCVNGRCLSFTHGVPAGRLRRLASFDYLDFLLWLNRNGIGTINSLAFIIELCTQNTGWEGWPRQGTTLLLNFLEESLQGLSFKTMIRTAKDTKVSPSAIVPAMTASGRPVKHTKDKWIVSWHRGPHPCLHMRPWGA